MISTPTVFVLGAGASFPYNFPLGSTLKQWLYHQISLHDPYFTDAMQGAGFDKEQVISFLKSFAGSSQGSIDRFLSRQLDLQPVGKAAIAALLMKQESPDYTYRWDNTDNWYSALWDAMIDGVLDPTDLSRNRVKFVTFNYDRSLEFFLHEATKNSFPGLDDKTAMTHWKRLAILHVYGELGEFHYAPSDGFRTYNDCLARGGEDRNRWAKGDT